MSINVSYYDITQIDFATDSNDDGAIPQSGTNTWKPLTVGFKKANFKVAEQRIEHRGNLQTLQIDKRVKKWLEWELNLLALKYDGTAPALDWWDIINLAFYGGATGSPALRPGKIFLALKINRTTPEYWTGFGARIEEVVLSGDMTQNHLDMQVKGVARGFRLDTNNYVQGTATRRTDPAKTPIIPAQDLTIKYNATDITTLVQSWRLTLRRSYEKRGISASVTNDASHVGVDGSAYREFMPNTFDGRLELQLDPYGTVTDSITNQISDTALGTCELQIPNSTNGKQIQFTAAKTKGADQPHEEGKSPSVISLQIDGSTFNVNTL